jgi:type II secretory pathway pseudopilin PulG
MKAQAYLFELKKTGNELKVGDEAVKAAQSAIKIIQQDIQEYKLSGEKNPSDAEYLVKLAEQGAKLVSYKITEYSNKLTGEYSGENISLGYK